MYVRVYVYQILGVYQVLGVYLYTCARYHCTTIQTIQPYDNRCVVCQLPCHYTIVPLYCTTIQLCQCITVLLA
jgi:hypothetical protein